jgi:hypothetical protein
MKVTMLRYRFVIAILILPLVFYILIVSSSRTEVRYVYGILPVFIASNSRVINSDSTAVQRGVFVFITPSQFDNESLIQHEIVHVKRSYRTFSFSYWAALLSKRYLADVEAEAYILMAKSPKDFDWIAELIKEEYTPEVEKEYIIDCLKTHWTSRR